MITKKVIAVLLCGFMLTVSFPVVNMNVFAANKSLNQQCIDREVKKAEDKGESYKSAVDIATNICRVDQYENLTKNAWKRYYIYLGISLVLLFGISI